MLRLVLLTWTSCLVAGAPWQKLGPRNIGDDASGQGYAGTLADAVSPISNPNLIYTGGHNNGASSGVLKSMDRGLTWVPMCNGLFDTAISSLHIVDEKGDHVLAGTPSGIYETLDGAASWRIAPGTQGIGWARSMKNGTIKGEPHIIAGVDAGLAHWPIKSPGANWTVIKAPGDISKFITVADVLPSSVVGVCLGAGTHGTVFIATITGPTSAVWKNTSLTCMQMAINPNNKDHFIYSNMSSNGKETWESLDGGATHHDLNNHFPYHVAIDRQGWFYTAAEAGAHRSTDGGKTWQFYQMTTTQRGYPNATGHRIPMDYQRIPTDFAGGVAFVSDQGVFIKPAGESLELIGACGNLSNNIAISVAVSRGDGVHRWMVTTAWDWGPLASWDDGAHWPGWHCADCGGQSGIGEGGYTVAMGRSNHVLMIHHATVLHSSQGGKNFSRVGAPTGSFSPPLYTRAPNSRTEPDGRLFITMGVPAPTRDEGAASSLAVAAAAADDDGDESDDGEERDDDDEEEEEAAESDDEEEEEEAAESDGDEEDMRAGRDRLRDHARAAAGDAPLYLVKNRRFGAGPFDNATGWVWGAALPARLTPCSLATDPTDGATLYAVASSCIATSKDEGATWSPCWAGIDGPIGGLVIKDSTTMFLRRKGLVPLRTRDGGKSWSALDSFQPIAAAGFSMDLSWTGRTMVVHGVDMDKIAHGQKAVFVWRSTDDGETFVDETDDIVTNRPAGGHWYEGTFYISSSGQGILAKVFEASVEETPPAETA